MRFLRILLSVWGIAFGVSGIICFPLSLVGFVLWGLRPEIILVAVANMVFGIVCIRLAKYVV